MQFREQFKLFHEGDTQVKIYSVNIPYGKSMGLD